MIVLADADLERAANAAVHYSMQNGGQTCISVERVYVEEPVYDEFVGRSRRRCARCARACPASPASIDVGAVTSPPQMDLIDEHVRDAVAKGAHACSSAATARRGPGRLLRADAAGGRGPHDGVHDRGDLRSDAARDEGRGRRGGGPAGQRLALRPAGVGLDQGHRQGRAARARVESGVCCVNDAQINYMALELPMGGWKASGWAPATARTGSASTRRSRPILVTRFAPTNKDMHMLPYKASTTKLLGRMLKLAVRARQAAPEPACRRCRPGTTSRSSSTGRSA